MASLTKRHNTWFACFALADGTQTRRSTKQRDLGTPAERAETRRRAQQIAQFYEDGARGNSTEAQIRKTMSELFQKVNGRQLEFAHTGSYLTAWLNRVKLHKASTTWIRYDVIVRAFVKSIGPKADLPLGDISSQDIQLFLDAQLATGRRPASVRLCAKTLSTPFGRARREGIILTNPCATVELPQGASIGRLPFTWPQVRQIFDAAPTDWKTAVLLGAFCGARLSDCANMPWSAVDLEGGVIRFIPRKTASTGKEVIMPIHPVLAVHLRQLMFGTTVGARIPAPDGADSSGTAVPLDTGCDAGGNSSGHACALALCPSLAGRPVGGMNGLSREFKGVMHAAGVVEAVNASSAKAGPKQRKVPRLSFHSLRHTMVTALANAGVSPDLRQALAGHSSELMSERYTHRGLKLLQAAVEMLPMLDAAPTIPFPANPAPAEAAQPETQNQAEK